MAAVLWTLGGIVTFIGAVVLGVYLGVIGVIKLWEHLSR